MAAKDFHHPFQPYSIQQQFMEALYDCIENGQVGIFESPTGTGKSLSLICGSLTWLREYKRKMFDGAIAAVEVDDDDPEWMREHAREARRREMKQMRVEFEARLSAVRERERKVKERQTNGEPSYKKRKPAKEVAGSQATDEQFVLDDHESDGEQHSKESDTLFSLDTTKLMEELGMLPVKTGVDAINDDHDELKVLFCSRTHSQLSQFVGELQRVRLPPGLPPDSSETSDDPVEYLKHLSLGSRKNLCINPKVARLSSQTAVNERCVELQQSNTPVEHKCPYLPSKDTQHLVLEFRDHALARIGDIEDLALLGAKLGICSYYAARPAIGPAEVVTLPYPLLLHKSARDALGIGLKGHVVIIDEAHNVMNAIEGIYSVQISDVQLHRARECLMIYLQKFRNRLKGGNRVYLTQLVRVVDSLLACIANIPTKSNTSGVLDVGALLGGKGVDQINLAKLVQYISSSRLARKVGGYVYHLAEAQTGAKDDSIRTQETPVLTQLQNFLTTLMSPSKEGRFFWSRDNGLTIVRYLLLDPSELFREIVEEARAVILAGGTMSPIDDYRQQLFPYLKAFKTFTCGHLVPPSNLFLRIVAADQDGRLDFSYKSRSNPSSAMRIGRALVSLAARTTGGLVVFFPSYGFLEQVAESWRNGPMWEVLSNCKPLFLDSRAASADETFGAYKEAIKADRSGAILISVIGGKLSEGINFSDDLGRCVVVVGLPFPNLETSEWEAKLQYIDNKATSRGEPKGKASREHAESVCMRSVNQAIGRVIRHKDDWASILLMDSRYSDKRIRDKLPGWIKESWSEDASLAVSPVVEDLGRFFERKTSMEHAG